MKKNLSLLLALLLACVCCLIGCAKKGQNQTLTVAISPDFAPMEFVDTTKSGQDQYIGFDVSLAKYLAQEMGRTLVIKPMSFDACQAAVQTGTVDMSISGFSATAERAENYNLSDYYYAGDNETEQAIITVKSKEGTLTAAEDFAGLIVGAQAASLQLSLCNEQLPDTVIIKEFSDIGTAVEALRNNNIDALAVAKGNGDAIIANNAEIGFSGFQFVVSAESENNVILLKKGNDELTQQVNQILAKALAEGLYGAWYEEAKALAGIDTSAEVVYDDQGQVSD